MIINLLPAIALAVAAAAAPAPAHADDDACAVLGSIAAKVMAYRQAGNPMSDLMQQMLAIEGVEGDMRNLMKAIVIDAYNTPAYATPSNQERAVADFRNTIEVACYERF